MKLYRQISKWKEERQKLQGQTIGLIPTMGALHPGHLSLIEKSAQENDITVVSIFLNPTQFNKQSDLDNYPSTFEEDLELCKKFGATHVISPPYEDLYPDDYNYKISEKKLSPLFCGTDRPGHFDGVLTVIIKLFNLVKAQKAYFGEKDYQQLQLIKGLVDAFFMSTEVIGCPTIREEDGLPMSSRNFRLNTEQRQRATHFYQILTSSDDVDFIKHSFKKKNLSVNYVEVYNGRKFASVSVDDIRLIDNVPLNSNNS